MENSEENTIVNFKTRFLALLIDILINVNLCIIIFSLSYIVKVNNFMFSTPYYYAPIMSLVIILYFIILTAKYQATVGKIVMGIQIESKENDKIILNGVIEGILISLLFFSILGLEWYNLVINPIVVQWGELMNFLIPTLFFSITAGIPIINFITAYFSNKKLTIHESLTNTSIIYNKNPTEISNNHHIIIISSLIISAIIILFLGFIFAISQALGNT